MSNNQVPHHGLQQRGPRFKLRHLRAQTVHSLAASGSTTCFQFRTATRDKCGVRPLGCTRRSSGFARGKHPNGPSDLVVAVRMDTL